MIYHAHLNDEDLRSLIRSSKLNVAGNASLKIYGSLHCCSGKRMKRLNRVFFTSTAEAVMNGYRPCGHCLPHDYAIWKDSKKQIE